MFTGIVEELGEVVRIERQQEAARLTVRGPLVVSDATHGGSIAVNGCCLTVVDKGDGWWAADVVDESVARTNLGDLRPGDPVNLERPVRLEDRLGGHLVQGHVDTVGEVVTPAPNLRVRMPPELTRYVVEKGSITVDGCSLTVAGVDHDRFRVAVIPHTAEVTTLGLVGVGDRVNLEVDIMAKHAEKLLAAHLGTALDASTAPGER